MEESNKSQSQADKAKSQNGNPSKSVRIGESTKVKDNDQSNANGPYDGLSKGKTDLEALDDGVDSILFVHSDDDGENEEENDDENEWEEGDEEEEEDPCLLEEEEEEEEEAGPEKKSEASTKKTSKGFRKHQFIKHEICIPDKPFKPRPVPKGKPWYLQKKRDYLEKRQDSNIVFNMPRQEDPEVIALRKTNKMVQKLIKYMKKSWKVRVNRKQEDRELEHRTLASVYTRKPDDWLEKIRSREDRALETGFFSPLDIPYEALIDLELDTALLTFKNLPPDLKISASRWIRTKLRKEELKRKRDAFLPRVPHGKVKRPSYSKGRLLKDPGGISKVDQFVKVAERFYKVTRGNTPFSKALKEWDQLREKESHSSNSGFGVIREGTFDFSRKNRSSSDKKAKNKDDERRVSIVDARKYQRDMLDFEKFMIAIYNIMKSLLNIKIKQLESKFPLPPTAVLHIRASSPDSGEKAKLKKDTPMLILQRNARKTRSQSIFGLGHQSFSIQNLDRRSVMISPPDSRKTADDREDDDPSELLSHGKILSANTSGAISIRKSLADIAIKDRRKSDVRGLIQAKGGAEGIAVNDIVNLSPVRSTTDVVDNIKREHSFQDMMELKSMKQTMLTAEQKIKRLAENPEHAAIRRARNYMSYMKLFERNKKLKKPVWHNIDIAELALDFKANTGLAGKDPANLTEADAAQVVELALKKRRTMTRKTGTSTRDGEDDDEEPVNRRWPEEFDIPTPTFPFPNSTMKIASEELSRQNLLKKTPHMDESPSTPVRRLYKLAGVRTTEMDLFNNIMEMKKMFRVTENKLRVYYENEIGKWDWDTLKRFRCKLNGIHPFPVYQWTIAVMRLNQDHPKMPKKPGAAAAKKNSEEEEDIEKALKQKRPALWYTQLKGEAEMNGATRHNGCHTELQKLLKYCDVDMKTKPHMLNRLALLAVSLPATELGTKHWQRAIVFLLEHMFGAPQEVIHGWLKYRGIPYLL